LGLLERRHAFQYNTIPPDERLQKIMRHAHALGVFDPENAVLRAFGITVLENSNKVGGRSVT
jgi:hypothetical protein